LSGTGNLNTHDPYGVDHLYVDRPGIDNNCIIKKAGVNPAFQSNSENELD